MRKVLLVLPHSPQDDELKKKEQDLNSHKEQMKPVMSERDELKRFALLSEFCWLIGATGSEMTWRQK